MKFNRIFLIVCDSMGIGNAKDAKKYNDFGANTVGHICSICDGLNIPTLQNLGYINNDGTKYTFIKSQLNQIKSLINQNLVDPTI